MKTKCQSCGDIFTLKHDNEGVPLNYWTDLKNRIYCDQCFYELYTEPEEKALKNWDNPNKSIRESARKKINELEKFWGIPS